MLQKKRKRGNIVKLKESRNQTEEKTNRGGNEYLNIGTVNLSLDQVVCKNT